MYFIVSPLKLREFSQNQAQCLITGSFQDSSGIFQFLPDGDTLGAMLLAFAAADAATGGGGIFP
jgi:hypothetical protein